VVGALDRTLLGGLRGDRPLTVWMERLCDVLASVYSADGIPGDDGRAAQTRRALAALGAAAAEVAAHPSSLDPDCSASTAIRILLDSVEGVTLPPPEDASAIEIVGWLELHLDDAPVVVLCGLNEGRLPSGVTSDPFLPDGLLGDLGLEDDTRRFARDAYRLTVLLSGDAELRLVAGRQTETGDPLRPSRLLFAEPPAVAARRILRFYGDEAEQVSRGSDPPAKDPTRLGDADDAATEDPTYDDQPRPSHAIGFVLPPQRVLRLPGDLTRLRVTDFSRILADPYGFVLERILRLEPQDDDAWEIDPLRFGSLAHTVLERFGAGSLTNSTDADEIFSTLETELERQVRDQLARHPRVSATVQVELLRARLRTFAQWQAKWRADGWTIVAVEAAPEREGAPLEVDGTSIGISARVDRIDYHPDLRAWAIFDYKTSEKAADPASVHGPDRDGRWKDLQLPLYRWLLPHLRRDDGSPIFDDRPHEAVRVGYINLSGKLDAVGEAFADWSPEQFADAVESARDVVRFLGGGEVTFDPNYRPKYSDRRMDALLGRGILGGDPGVAGSEGDEW
jgi:hypothetical protein